MNVMGEVVSMVGLSAVAGTIIGWCIRNFFGGSEKSTRQHFARDLEEASKDTKLLRSNLDKKNAELHSVKNQLQLLRSKDDSTSTSTRAQVTEINELKNQLAAAKKLCTTTSRSSTPTALIPKKNKASCATNWQNSAPVESRALNA